MRLFPRLLVTALGVVAQLAEAQAPVAARPAATTISGVVHDSLARAPLAGATVQLVAADTSTFGKSVTSDSLGRFTISDVPAGRYMIGFLHPLLDSLGLEPTLRAVSVDGRGDVRVALAIPSPARLRAAICGGGAQGSDAVLMGFVRDARSRAPVAGVKVSGDWLELSFGTSGITRRTPRRVDTTRDNGWFALCNVPSPGTMLLLGTRGADSTDFVETQVPASGFMRRDLYLGAVRTVVVRDASARSDTAGARPRRVHLGDGRVTGTVIASSSGRPLAGAQVGIANGPQTRANERGEWTLVDAPGGTRTLEVRAVGYYPERRPIEVVDGAPPVSIALATFKSVLDTMKVIATRDLYTNFRGFQQRSRSGAGRYLTAEDIAKRQPSYTSDLFRALPGIYVDGREPETPILMRGIFEERCEPAIFINGHQLNGVTTADIDAFVAVRDLVGVEIYVQGTAPAQFQGSMNGCGSLVFWTR